MWMPAWSAGSIREAGRVVALLFCLLGAEGAVAGSADDALLRAAALGDKAAVVSALNAGAAIDARDAQLQTPLLIAVQNDNRDVAAHLIARGADINAVAANEDTPWLLAGALGRASLLAAMLETGKVDYTKRNRYGGNALIPACERGHVETVRLLLERSEIDVNHVNNLGWTGLLEAVILSDGGPRHIEIVRLLLEHGADPNIVDKDGVSPLKHAQDRRYDAMAALIKDAGGR
jgi:ankyrin repeat protein